MTLTDRQLALLLLAIEQRITALTKLRQQMVGSLYPPMVAAEIEELRRVKVELQRATPD